MKSKIVGFEEGEQLCEAGHCCLRECRGEPATDINLLEFGCGQIRDATLQAAGTTQCAVVDDYRNTIACETNVKLNSIGSGRNRFTESSHCVFRRDRRRSAMTDDQWCRHDCTRAKTQIGKGRI